MGGQHDGPGGSGTLSRRDHVGNRGNGLGAVDTKVEHPDRLLHFGTPPERPELVQQVGPGLVMLRRSDWPRIVRNRRNVSLRTGGAEGSGRQVGTARRGRRHTEHGGYSYEQQRRQPRRGHPEGRFTHQDLRERSVAAWTTPRIAVATTWAHSRLEITDSWLAPCTIWKLAFSVSSASSCCKAVSSSPPIGCSLTASTATGRSPSGAAAFN